MTAKEINEFMDMIGTDANYKLFGDNAIIFPKTNSSHLIVDENEDMLYYLSNNGNTMEYLDTPTELIKCHTENIQYCRAYLSNDETEALIDKLESMQLIDSDTKKALLDNKVLFGQSSKIPKKEEITVL